MFLIFLDSSPSASIYSPVFVVWYLITIITHTHTKANNSNSKALRQSVINWLRALPFYTLLYYYSDIQFKRRNKIIFIIDCFVHKLHIFLFKWIWYLQKIFYKLFEAFVYNFLLSCVLEFADIWVLVGDIPHQTCVCFHLEGIPWSASLRPSLHLLLLNLHFKKHLEICGPKDKRPFLFLSQLFWGRHFLLYFCLRNGLSWKSLYLTNTHAHTLPT